MNLVCDHDDNSFDFATQIDHLDQIVLYKKQEQDFPGYNFYPILGFQQYGTFSFII